MGVPQRRQLALDLYNKQSNKEPTTERVKRFSPRLTRRSKNTHLASEEEKQDCGVDLVGADHQAALPLWPFNRSSFSKS